MQKTVRMLVMLGVVGGLGSGQAFAQVTTNVPTPNGTAQKGGVTSYAVPQTGGNIDYVRAQAMPLPIGPSRSAAEVTEDMINALTEQVTLGEAAVEDGAIGNGNISLVRLGVPQGAATSADDVEPQEFGTNSHPFSTARADLFPTATNTAYPYRASGKLFFNIGGSTFVCSASLIKRGIVVTAAHCVANFGQRQFYSNWRFVPGYRNGSAPFGTWTAQTALILTSYFNGTDPCAVAGIVCRDDVALLRLNPQANAFPGAATGWYGFGFNGFGFTGNALTHITQIGYPVCLDNGAFMERNDSQGFVSAGNSNNTIIGSLMCGGSSGGPWLVNFGIRPTLTGTVGGMAPNPNIVVGVTSWGFINMAIKDQGASPFLSGNINTLVNAACPAGQPACAP